MTMFFAKKLNKKGFTLAEMLIVVAIIAILVAIAVPIFTSQLEKAKIARDKANLRTLRIEAVTVILGQDNVDLSNQHGWQVVGHITDDQVTIKSISILSAAGTTENATPGTIDYSQDIQIVVTGQDLSSIKVS